MKSKKILFLSAVAVLALTGCHGTKKVDFKTFVSDVANREVKVPEIKKVKVSGKYDDEKYSFSVTRETRGDLSIKESGLLALITATNVGEYAVIEDKDATYYVGNGYKFKNEKIKLEFDEYGSVTLIKGEFVNKTANLNIKYTYEK